MKSPAIYHRLMQAERDRRTLTTVQAAHLAGVDPRSFARWARAHGITPLHRVRIGRSWVTAWDRDSLTRSAA